MDLKTLRTPKTDLAILEAMLVAAQTGGSLPVEASAPAAQPTAPASAPVASGDAPAETVAAPAASGSSAVDRIRERARAAKAAAEAKGGN